MDFIFGKYEVSVFKRTINHSSTTCRSKDPADEKKSGFQDQLFPERNITISEIAEIFVHRICSTVQHKIIPVHVT